VSKEYVPKGVSLVVLRSPPKWVNIVLDINCISFHCMEKAATSKMPFVNDVREGIHSSTISTILEPKVVFTHLGLLGISTVISKFATRVFI
jgi:hypothetical protein